MTTYARIENGVAVELFVPHSGAALADCFHPEVATLFTSVPDNVTLGSTVDSKRAWTIAPVSAPTPVPAPPLPMLTPMTFYLAFTPAERIAIKASSDANVQEFWAAYELAVSLNKNIDPNLKSVQQSVAYLGQKSTDTPPGPGILASKDRIAQILAGIPQ